MQQNITAGTIITRGDSGQENDAPTSVSLGRIIAIERGGRTITAVGNKSRLAAKLNSTLLRLRLAFMRRSCVLLSLIFRAAFVLVTCLLVNVSPAAGQADLSISQSASAPVVAAGSNVVYTIVINNNGPNLSQNVVFYENIPANTTFQSIGIIPAGWACTTPGVGGTTPINCTIASLANAATATFTVTLQVNAGTAAETAVQNVTSVTSNTTIDPVASNNTAFTTVLVGITGDADLQLTLSASPNPVFVSSPLTYTIVVQNLGVANATSTSITDTLPGTVTFVSATATQGTCTQSAGVVTCTLGTLTASSTATATINVTAPGTSTSLTDTASTTSSVTDPFPSNNSGSVVTFVEPLSCANPARDGAGGTLSGKVNTYYAPSAPVVLAPGAKTVTLGAASGANTPIAVGDLLLIMQMQDAAINFTNTGAYGDGTPGDPATGYTSANSSGRYEFVSATSALTTAGGALTFSGAGPSGGILNTYTEAAYSAGVQGQRSFQVIRVPQYQSATLSSTLAPLAWNGTVGGVLALDIAGQLTLGGTVSANALGFRGGGGRKLTGGAGGSPNDYVTLATFAANGSKGEGISGTPRYLVNSTFSAVINSAIEGLPNGSYARGAPGNAGGGGTDADPAGNTKNSGGGGGGNGSGGGSGGYAWNTASLGNGFGGAPFPGSVSNLIMGGGGGAGTSNDGTADPANANPAGINSSGAAGGGIIIVHAGAVVGTGTLTANGQAALDVLNDGAGGGGAGGSIELLVLSGGISGATLSANGGDGGDTWLPQVPGSPYPGNRHGPGGGGGGGVILTSSAPASASALPGSNGTSTTIQDAYGATPGLGNGIITTNLGSAGFTQTPGNRPGAQCSIADMVVTNSGTPNPVVPGGNITYTQTVNNNGPQPAVNVVFSEAIPSNTTFVSLASPAAWTCITPAVGASGNISCTLPSNDPNVLSTFTLVVQVGVATPTGTTISDTDSVSSGVNDNNLANNTATVNTLVASPASANIAVTNSAAPSTVAPSANITYTQSLTNNGPAIATTVNFTEAIPTNTTFVSLASPGSWSCTTPAVGATGTVTCSIATLAVGATASFTLITQVNAGTATGTVITDTDMGSSAITDPNLSNNSATANVTVAQANQADMAVTMSENPNPVLAGANITYTAVVTNNGPATATTVTAVDTIPANTTFSSDTVPPGWTCVVNATTVSCSNPSMAANTTSTFTFIFTVTAGTAPGTVITNSVTVGSAVSDPTSSNNTATTTDTVTSPSQADLSINKSGAPEPVNQGDTLTYTLTVANNGPASANNVVVTDPLPSAVTYQSSSATQGACSQAGGTVTCNIGAMSNGQIVTITISVTATTFSASSFAVNTATVSSTTSDPNPSNNSSTFNSTIISPTVVQLIYFQARPRTEGALPAGSQSGGVLLEWRTREEIRNLGFNIYREDAFGRHRVNPSIIAGAALFIRGGKPQHGAKTYQWIDPAGTSESSYVLEDVDLNGTRSSHGPVNVESSTTSATYTARSTSRVANSTLLTHLNQLTNSESQLLAPVVRSLVTPRPTIERLLPGEFRASLDGQPAVKISVRGEGWYRVTQSALVAAGLRPDADSRLLQLYAEGIEQPMLISGRGTGPLGPNEAIEFYGTGIDTPFSDTRVYWLIQGTRPGQRIAILPSSGSGATDNSQGFLFTVVREDRTTYLATLLNGEDKDNFFGAAVTSEPVDQTLTVANHVPNSALPVTLDITLQGATDGQVHRVSVVFNGASIGEMDFTGQVNVTNTFPIESTLVTEGVNTVTLTALEGDNDVSVVQSIALHYSHAYAADQNWLRATANAGSVVHITGFASPQIHIFDISHPLAIKQLTGAVALEGSTYSITATLRPGFPASHTLVAFAEDQISSPSALTYHAPSHLASRRDDADLIYISHPEFVASLAPLQSLRESQKHDVSIVTVDELYDAFNFGERSPYAIRNFLQFAASQNRKPQAVLFVGDASFDPRNYLGFGDFDFVPTRIVETAAFKTASDDWFTDFQGNGFATIPTGRLPVRTAAEAALTVQKIVGYEQGSYAGTWNQQALVVADNNEGANFSTSANAAAATLQPLLDVTKILADGQDPTVIKQQILDGLNAGSLIVNYNGHGSTEQWSFMDLFDDKTAASLTNGQHLPVYLLMDCLNGFFDDVYTQSLAESLLLSPNGGGVAVWASSGFTNAQPQAFLNQALLTALAQNPNSPLGAAILAAKSGITDADVRRTWILFGDPAMHLHFAASSAGQAAPSTPQAKKPVTANSDRGVRPRSGAANYYAP
ncbi:MAG TPA: C25 family cysteine peptidase [Candidatus Acidoferrum sp.]|nr:C25 family cysteine peptidase [Candidatus Acidoferrum sp.]